MDNTLCRGITTLLLPLPRHGRRSRTRCSWFAFFFFFFFFSPHYCSDNNFVINRRVRISCFPLLSIGVHFVLKKKFCFCFCMFKNCHTATFFRIFYFLNFFFFFLLFFLFICAFRKFYYSPPKPQQKFISPVTNQSVPNLKQNGPASPQNIMWSLPKRPQTKCGEKWRSSTTSQPIGMNAKITSIITTITIVIIIL